MVGWVGRRPRLGHAAVVRRKTVHARMAPLHQRVDEELHQNMAGVVAPGSGGPLPAAARGGEIIRPPTIARPCIAYYASISANMPARTREGAMKTPRNGTARLRLAPPLRL